MRFTAHRHGSYEISLIIWASHAKSHFPPTGATPGELPPLGNEQMPNLCSAEVARPVAFHQRMLI